MRHWWCLLPALVAPLAGCGEIKPGNPVAERRAAAVKLAEARRLKRACGSQQTFERLKAIAFAEAARVRRVDSPELRRLAGVSVARMEDPVATTRDDGLGLTVCSGRLIVELPPGAEDVFDGDRRLEARVEYAAQQAAYGEGLVYRMQGAEPIVYRLAAFDLPGRLSGGAQAGPVALAAAGPAPVPVDPVPASVPASIEADRRVAPARAAAAARPSSAAAPTPSVKRVDTAKKATSPDPARSDAESRRRSEFVASAARSRRTPAVRTEARSASPKPPVRLAARSGPRVAAKPVRQTEARRRKPLSASRSKPPARVAGQVRERVAEAAKTTPIRVRTGKPKPPVRLARAAASPKTAKPWAPTAKKPVVPKTAAAAPRSPYRLAPIRITDAQPARWRAAARSGFGCDDVRGRVERLLCADPELARMDRRVNATLYAALADADPDTRYELRRSRARFISYRDRCASAACVAQAYADRLEEIRDIESGRY